jgi:hypothetical protein
MVVDMYKLKFLQNLTTLYAKQTKYPNLRRFDDTFMNYIAAIDFVRTKAKPKKRIDSGAKRRYSLLWFYVLIHLAAAIAM